MTAGYANIQGTYLGYMVGVLTSLERRFELSSSKSGFLLSMYDIGNTLATVFVGYCGAKRHKPRWTAVGAILSALAMFGWKWVYLEIYEIG